MLRISLFVFLGILLLSSTGLFLVTQYISPATFPVLAQLLFFSLLFFVSFSFFTLINYFIRRLVHPRLNKFILFHLSTRQGVLLALFVCISAYFIHLNVFTWWSELLVLFFLLFIEIFFVVKENK